MRWRAVLFWLGFFAGFGLMVVGCAVFFVLGVWVNGAWFEGRALPPNWWGCGLLGGVYYLAGLAVTITAMKRMWGNRERRYEQ